MDLQEARQIVEDYFLAHATTMTPRQCTAFLIMLISFPLIPEYVHNMGKIDTLDDPDPQSFSISDFLERN